MKAILVFSPLLAISRTNSASVLFVSGIPMDINEYHWITLIMILLLIVVICLYQNKRNKKELTLISAKNAELEDIIALKDEEHLQTLSDLHTLANSTDKRLYLVSKFVSFISHDVHAPLKYLSFSAEKIPELITSNELDEVAKVSTFMLTISDRMVTMLNPLIPFLKTQLYDSHASPTAVDVKQLLEEKSDLIHSKIQRNGSTWHNQIAAGCQVEACSEMLSMIVENLLAVSARYTTNGQINVSFTQTGEMSNELLITNSLPSIPDSLVALLEAPVDEEQLKNLFRYDQIDNLHLLIVIVAASLSDIQILAEKADCLRFYIRW